MDLRSAMRRIVDKGTLDLSDMSVCDQIAMHQAAAIALQEVDKDASEISAHAAELLRETERHQLKFRELLRS